MREKRGFEHTDGKNFRRFSHGRGKGSEPFPCLFLHPFSFLSLFWLLVAHCSFLSSLLFPFHPPLPVSMLIYRTTVEILRRRLVLPGSPGQRTTSRYPQRQHRGDCLKETSNLRTTPPRYIVPQPLRRMQISSLNSQGKQSQAQACFPVSRHFLTNRKAAPKRCPKPGRT